MKTPLTSLVSASSSLKPMKKRNHFGKVKAALANGSDVVTIALRIFKCQLELIFLQLDCLTDFFSQLMIIRCHFHSLNGRHKWPQLYGSLSLLVLYMAWIFRMMPLLMLFIHEPKTLQIWISLRVCKCCPHIGLSHIGIQHIHASSPSSGKKS